MKGAYFRWVDLEGQQDNSGTKSFIRVSQLRLSRSPTHCAFNPKYVVIAFEYGLQG